MSRELWEQVRERLRDHTTRHGEGRKTEARQSPLAGKLFDENGEPLYVQGAAKGERRYRYYVSRKLVIGASEEAKDSWRLSAPELERVVSAAIEAMLTDHDAIAKVSEESGLAANRLPSVLKSAQQWIERLRAESEAGSTLAQLAERVQLSHDGVRVSLELPTAATAEPPSSYITLTKFIPIQMKRRGVETRLVLEGDSRPSRTDLPLLKAVARSRRWTDDLISGRVTSIAELAKREGIESRSVRRLIRLGFLSPHIVEAIAEGRQPPDLTVIGLTRRVDLPFLWSTQEQAIGTR